MIERLAKSLQEKYIAARISDGTATEESLSAPLFEYLIESGLSGIPEGIRETRKLCQPEENNPLTPLEKEIIFWGGIALASVQITLIVAGFRGRTTGNWDWYRKLAEEAMEIRLLLRDP